MDRYYLQAAILALVTLFAWRIGSREQRIVATTLSAVFILVTIYGLVVGRQSDWIGIPYHRFAFDIVALGIFLFLWVKGNSWWLLWVASAQLLSVMAHFARLLDLPLPPLGYAVMEIWPFWLAILATGIAIFLHHKRKPVIE